MEVIGREEYEEKYIISAVCRSSFITSIYNEWTTTQQRQKNWAEKGIVIREVEILGKRPMKDIGVQQTRFDSLVLKENIALSMADILTFNSSIFVKSYGRATLSTVSFRERLLRIHR